MKGLITIAAAAALMAGVTVANAQTGTPGAGSPGQDQRPNVGTTTGPTGNSGSATTQDAPSGQRGTSTSGAGNGGAMAPRSGAGTGTPPGQQVPGTK